MKNAFKRLDKTLFFLTIILSIFGLIMIFSSSSISAVLQYKVSEYYFFYKQALFLIFSLILSFIIFVIPTKWYRKISVVGILGIILVLVALKTYGHVTNSARSWFKIFGFSLQPSEFAKTFIIIYLAFWYGKKKKFASIYDTFIPLIPCVVIFFLVASEPDLGTAAIIASICMFIFFTLPFNKNGWMMLLKFGTITSIIGVLVFLNGNTEILTSTQASRFNFKNPCSRYLEETGYQVCNGYIAINNGGLFGVGLGKSTQKYLYLPESHTDFIFPIIVEELGLVAGGVVLLAYIIILYRTLVIARNAKTLSGSIIAFGTFAYILTHIIINIGGLLALIPLTGVPLPFLSYGGSFIINLLILIAMTQRVAIETKLRKQGS
ncbi:MAG: FtsW/RodA/SpoVE family cell cycle protein [Erysipelotrichales bacterium]|nr:FtsW/RodA/SpoVE family cell cycle protein [Erysipelotrichales bacterium]